MRWDEVGEVGGGKNNQLGHPLSSHDTRRHPHNGPCHVGRPKRQWEQSYVPTT